MDWCIVVIDLITLRSHFLWHVRLARALVSDIVCFPFESLPPPFFLFNFWATSFLLFFLLFYRDFPKIDLVLVMSSLLKVHRVATNRPEASTPAHLVSLECLIVGRSNPAEAARHWPIEGLAQ